MVSIRIVVRGDLDHLFALEVHPDQRSYVAPNLNSIAEFAYIDGGYVFSIRSDAEIVGLMGIIDFQEHHELGVGDDPKAAFLMRMMVADRHQGRGVGSAALRLAFDWARARGNTCFQTSYVPGNEDAARFYESLGLRKTGRIVEDEIEMSVPL